MRLDVSSEEIKQIPMAQWVFESVDKGTSLILDERQVLLQTVQYDSFEPFVERYLAILDKVMKKTDHSSFGVIERLGLRYVDQIRKQSEDDDVASYLRPQLRGMDSAFFKNSSKRYSFATLGDTELRNGRKGKLSIRIIRNNEGLDLPPDLIPDAPRRSRQISSGQDLALIDMDHGCDGPIGPGIKQEELEELFFGLHDIVIEVLYESVASEEGIRKWKLQGRFAEINRRSFAILASDSDPSTFEESQLFRIRHRVFVRNYYFQLHDYIVLPRRVFESDFGTCCPTRCRCFDIVFRTACPRTGSFCSGILRAQQERSSEKSWESRDLLFMPGLMGILNPKVRILGVSSRSPPLSREPLNSMGKLSFMPTLNAQCPAFPWHLLKLLQPPPWMQP